jgi:hypothetical protein
MKKIGILLLILGPSLAMAQTAAVTGHCTLGGTPAAVSGLKSTNYLQGIIPSCTVTVYQTGTTTLATIYSDKNNTPLSNPFTANAATSSDPGAWTFFVDVSTAVDVVGSGGIEPNVYRAPVTLLTDAFPGQQSAGCGNPGSGVIPKGAPTGSGCLTSAVSDDGVKVNSTEPIIAPANLSKLTPIFDVEAAMSSADGHGGQDVGYATAQLVNALADTGLCHLNFSHSYLGPSQYKVWTPLNIPKSCIADGLGSAIFQPQDGGANGVWSSTDTRVKIVGATITAGSPTITFPSTAGLQSNMRIGGRGIGNGNYILPTPSTTSLTLAATPQLCFVGIPTNGSATLIGVNNFSGLVGGGAQTFALQNSTPAGGTSIWTFSGGGLTATLTSFDKVARTATMSATVSIRSDANVPQRPVSLCMTSGTYTANLTSIMATPVATMPYPSGQYIASFEGFALQGGLRGITIMDPAYGGASFGSTLRPGRSLYGVQGVQVTGFDGFQMPDLHIYGIMGAGLIIGGDDYQTYCQTSVGGMRESHLPGADFADTGDFSTGQGNIEILGPACGGSTISDQPNQLYFSGTKVMAPWGPSLVIGSFAPTSAGNPRQIYFDGCQFEAGARTQGYATAPSINVDIQRADDIHFSNCEIARGPFPYANIRAGSVSSITEDNNTIPLGGVGAFVGSWTMAFSNGSASATYVSAPSSVYSHFPTDGSWDNQFFKATVGGSSFYFYTGDNAVSGDGLTLTMVGPWANTTGNGTVTTGYAGYPVLVTNSLGEFHATDNTYLGWDADSLNNLSPGGGLYQAINLAMSGGCPGTWNYDFLNFRNASSCVFASSATAWGTGTPQTPFRMFCPAMTAGFCRLLLGISDSSAQAIEIDYDVANNKLSIGTEGATNKFLLDSNGAIAWGGSSGTISTPQVVSYNGGGYAATIAAGTGLGTGGSVACDTTDGFACTSQAGVVTMTVGTGAVAGSLFTSTWTTALPKLPQCGFSNYASVTLAASLAYFDAASTTTTKITFSSNAGVPAGTYKVGYRCQ